MLPFFIHSIIKTLGGEKKSHTMVEVAYKICEKNPCTT